VDGENAASKDALEGIFGARVLILISCVKTKLNRKAKARNLYLSDLFKKTLQYAELLRPDKIFILSAKYGLVALDDEIEPYEKTLNTASSREIKEWANSVVQRLRTVTDLNQDEFVFLAGDKYRKCLLPHIKNYEIPMLGLSFGRQLQWLGEKIGHE
jgi:hypothetical protein